MGILDFVKKAFSNSGASTDSAETSAENCFEEIIEATRLEAVQKYQHFWSVKLSELSVYQEQIASLSANEKVDLLLYCIYEIHKWQSRSGSYSTNNPGYHRNVIQYLILQSILRAKLSLSDEQIVSLAAYFLNYKRYSWPSLLHWPLGYFLIQVERNTKGKVISEKVKATLLTLKAELEKKEYSNFEKERTKYLSKVDGLLSTGEEKEEVKPVYFLGKDKFSDYANPIIKLRPQKELPHWYSLLVHAQKAAGGKPTQKYLKEGQGLVTVLGADTFKEVVLDWFKFIIHLKENELVHTYTHAGQTYTHTTYDLLSSPNVDAIKGLVWLCASLTDRTALATIAGLAERAYRKIPGKGPAAAAVGNACLYTLYQSEGLEGISHLSRLKLRIRQSSTQNLIEKYLQEAAKEQGISVHEIEDLAVDQYGLEEGHIEYELENFKAVLEIAGVGKTELKWFKPDGSSQKSVPSAVKEKQPVALKQIKETAKQIEVTLSAQRDRLDRMFKAERVFTWQYFQQYYVSHGLLSYLTKRLIWIFEKDGVSQNVFFFNNAWRTSELTIAEAGPETMVRLWHPAMATISEIEAWRRFLVEHQILQPFKQAYREVYLLTDAEVNTRVYSNRMAAHLLKQHQFNSLAKIRGWKYALMGAYDDGRYNEAASCHIPDYNLLAEYWVNEVNADDAFNDTGIWNYIATDQLRFVNTQTNQVVELISVPKVVFSEVMRDVDLFVGVCTVGNDPTWQDSGGVPAYRDYWQAYSFGDLSEVAKTRKEILTQLLPRLKVAKVAEIKDKFLVVKGKLRTYKIHLGSTNILMEPNDQYLCIVPDRSKKDVTGTIFLPFEGDNGLSVILSKALLLADDDKITDSTITSQIKRF
ncbi:DUF4132 domain-containing protein [Rufibacter roseus]|uniref:DUF4132 domain-containing protein n=1 Tax=Rufibacter roseus TaxID=1567108 RepID=A0ABW2DLY2_9BACT|nr:DUF4132 domain-containing protein [Rufibacter roseus]